MRERRSDGAMERRGGGGRAAIGSTLGMALRTAQDHGTRLKREHRTGFTLVEVLVAILVISIVLPVVMYGISMATTTAGVARHRTEATTLARSKLDELLANQTVAALQAGTGDFGDRWPEYKWSADVDTWNTDAVQGLTSSMQQLKVSVTWMQRGQEHSVVLSTLVYQSSTAGGTP